MREVALSLANQGFAAAAIEYRLAPLNPFPAAVEDVRAFIAFARDHAQEWKIDPENIASLGNSAGGHLACMAGLTGEPHERANAVVDICGITDLSNPREKHFSISWSFLEAFMGVEYAGNEQTFRDASPLSHVDYQSPPFLVIHGEQDDIVSIEQSEILVRALEHYGVKHEYYSLPGEMHSFSFGAWAKIEQLFVEFLHNQFSHALR
jgi:acetyl esterase/lipase